MKREQERASGPVLIPGVVSLAASSRRTLKHGDSFAMFAIGLRARRRYTPT